MTDRNPASGNDTGLPSASLTLLDFAREASYDDSEERFIEMMRQVLPLDELRNMTEAEALMFHSAVSWLYDYSLLLTEFFEQQGQAPSPVGGQMAPCVPGSHGPFILNCLTRGDDAPDFTQLETFGLEVSG